MDDLEIRIIKYGWEITTKHQNKREEDIKNILIEQLKKYKNELSKIPTFSNDVIIDITKTPRSHPVITLGKHIGRRSYKADPFSTIQDLIHEDLHHHEANNENTEEAIKFILNKYRKKNRHISDRNSALHTIIGYNYYKQMEKMFGKDKALELAGKDSPLIPDLFKQNLEPELKKDLSSFNLAL